MTKDRYGRYVQWAKQASYYLTQIPVTGDPDIDGPTRALKPALDALIELAEDREGRS